MQTPAAQHDLNEAINALAEASECQDESDSRNVATSLTLGIALSYRHSYNGSDADLNAAIILMREAIASGELSPQQVRSGRIMLGLQHLRRMTTPAAMIQIMTGSGDPISDMEIAAECFSLVLADEPIDDNVRHNVELMLEMVDVFRSMVGVGERGIDPRAVAGSLTRMRELQQRYATRSRYSGPSFPDFFAISADMDRLFSSVGADRPVMVLADSAIVENVPKEALVDPKADFAAELRRLREKAGSPSYREMGSRAHYSISALLDAERGTSIPSLATALAYVRACGGDVDEYRALWQALFADARGPVAEARQESPHVAEDLTSPTNELRDHASGHDRFMRKAWRRVRNVLGISTPPLPMLPEESELRRAALNDFASTYVDVIRALDEVETMRLDVESRGGGS